MRPRARLQLRCSGIVQGVGFRPFVHRLAMALELAGEVENVRGSVRIDLEGERDRLESFLERLPREIPPPAQLEPLEPCWLPPTAITPAATVRIAAGAATPLGIGLVAPSLAADRAPCAACLAELSDPADRRFGYAFISCCSCGPRFSIATAEPFARAHTSLASFVLCPSCQHEFNDPHNRRFHAETIGCPACGPRLSLRIGTQAAQPPTSGSPRREDSATLIQRACELLGDGRIVALQGIGGFQLLVDAGNAAAVARLRRRKQRPAKPFALLVGDPAWISAHCLLDADELEALQHPAAPIVLLRRRAPVAEYFPAVAPGSPALGVMLPASPLHHLLIHAFGRPLVATSGNRSGETLCTDPDEAIERLAGIADAWLCHDRPIARPLDDSLLQVIDGRPALIRRARGMAPEALPLPTVPGAEATTSELAQQVVVALGGDLKSAPALAIGSRVWLAPHLGDLAEGSCQQRLAEGVAELLEHHGGDGALLVSDAHPGYLSHQLSHQLAATQPFEHREVPHHLAHALAVMAEHRLAAPVLAFCFDGLGYGSDPVAPLWGGELLQIDSDGWRRLASLRPFPLPGAGRAMAEPRRAALGLLAAAGSAVLQHPGARHTLAAFSQDERHLLLQAIASRCNSPLSSSVGRLFDAVASLLGLAQVLSHEGQGGLLLEGAAAQAPADSGAYPLPLPAMGRLDWQPLIEALLADQNAGVPTAVCAARFHNGLSQAIQALAVSAARHTGAARVVLAGGCFQNRILLERSIRALRAGGLTPFWGERVPGNDGGLALGQVWAVRRSLPINQREDLPSQSQLHVPGRSRSHPLDHEPATAIGA
ncbi:carbamoyltransferase HypF [Synechococcus sp. Cruz-9H2]|uniref:carbamoyltransferase HypF n=1 Tax=unclassified Synechococcus TaxID=2626047 RepID=UPI0020CDAFE9|nr:MULTISPECIES: carbamoyltransferase HypF [unclassified Synechococcus]MCP9820421.1 carbamoyltransferase HypF [Synechococcus sp. Cruz-9H2]MCP9844716.1 carbamoyltransferase HypF [Synechococcus sp. Edmonson 11F2]MCP9856851.1 carbamoyltransferase HypF [Synechococcus sp. Cruz-9C9]MCP9864124.1 carbamoyltransferase HypF [Synechococcus sp. Cruz-7E5]MCP9871319.1 carbamoyltransferase HypF [Synechococcus sp. Cruz-7B9]